MEYVHLVGAEEVSSAALTMRAAGHEMSQTASYIDEILRRHQQFLDDWLQRLSDVLNPEVPK